MSIIKRFLKQVVTGDNIHDYQHASRTFIDDQYALQPRHKHLFHVVFNFSSNLTSADMPDAQKRGMLHLMVKNIDLPQFNIDVEDRNQYNRHRITQHRINYQDVGISFHDDQSDLIRNLWRNYYNYFYDDGKHDSKIYTTDDVYDGKRDSSRPYWGMEDSSTGKQFFTSIQVYSIFEGRFVEHTLVNPVISSFSHDTHDYSSAEVLEHKMTIKYETVHYAEGFVSDDFPQNFATHHYDKTPSPLSPLGGGTNSILGQGGILDGIGEVGGLFGSGNIVGGIFGAARVFENSKGTNWKRVLKDEAIQVFKNGARNKNPLTGTIFMSSKNSRKRAPDNSSQTNQVSSTSQTNNGKASSNGNLLNPPPNPGQSI